MVLESYMLLAVVTFLFLGVILLIRYRYSNEIGRLNSELSSALSRLESADVSHSQHLEKIHQLKEAVALADLRLEHANANLSRQEDIHKSLEEQMKATFSKLAVDSLSEANQVFLGMTEKIFQQQQQQVQLQNSKSREEVSSLVAPIQKSLGQMDQKISELEKVRVGAYHGLRDQVDALIKNQSAWQLEATKLSSALGSPTVRGRWGEVQLRRVAEIAGMISYCDFFEQASAKADDGKIFRPDMVVRLPGSKSIIVDSKTPLSSYLQAQDSEGEARQRLLNEFLVAVKRQIQDLSSKAYWKQFESSPEFVVLFLPGESYFGDALRLDPALLEYSTKNNVILATPTSLISLLKAAYYGWKQESIAESVREISNLGKELHGRISDLTSHVGDVGKSLKNAVTSYNKMVGTLESRVLVSAKRFTDLKVGDSKKKIRDLSLLELETRPLKGAQPNADL